MLGALVDRALTPSISHRRTSRPAMHAVPPTPGAAVDAAELARVHLTVPRGTRVSPTHSLGPHFVWSEKQKIKTKIRQERSCKASVEWKRPRLRRRGACTHWLCVLCCASERGCTRHKPATTRLCSRTLLPPSRPLAESDRSLSLKELYTPSAPIQLAAAADTRGR